MDMHSLQRLVLRTCEENISLNNELASVHDELERLHVLLQEKEDLLEEKKEYIETLLYQLHKAGGGVPSHVGSTESYSSASCITVDPREQVTVEDDDDDNLDNDDDDDDDQQDEEFTEPNEELGDTNHRNGECCADALHDSSGSLPSFSYEDYSSGLGRDKEGCYAPTITSSVALEQNDYFSVQAAVEGVQKWFFLRGGHLPNIRDFISHYSSLLREILDVPLDRLFIAGLMSNPKVCVYTWKSESGEPLQERKIPKETWENRNTVYQPDAPFLLFLEHQTPRIRIKRSEHPHIPKDCDWYTEKGYQDYYALPMYYQGEFVGAMSWATKHPAGFSKKHLEFLARHLHALTTFLRLHTNDIILTTLANQLEDEVAERTADLASANQRIMQQSAAQLKNFACMSHEIRTPLNCIIGLSSLLASDETIINTMTETQRDSIRMIIRSGDLLLSVVNDVLDYSRLESGNIEINLEPTDVKAVLELVLSSMAPKMKARKLLARTHWDTQIPPYIQMDESRLQQILYNLLGNAVKFSKEGGDIEYTATVVTNTPNNDATATDHPQTHPMIRIAIRDHGKGIAKGDLATIFEPFNQGTGRTSRDYGGTGLGLAITANLVKGMNGTISVTSEPGAWTEFVVLLPCVEAYPHTYSPLMLLERDEQAIHELEDGGDDLFNKPQQESLTIDNEDSAPKRGILRQRTYGTVVDRACVRQDSLMGNSSHGGDGSSPPQQQQLGPRRPSERTMEKYAEFLTPQSRILVVDDNMVNRKVLVRMLDRMGYSLVDTAENGLVACELEAQHQYDLILMDMEMPVMDGLESCQTILARSRDRDDKPPKVIFVTAHALDTFQAKANEAGGSGFLTKPFHLKKLTSVLNSIEWQKSTTTNNINNHHNDSIINHRKWHRSNMISSNEWTVPV